MSLRRVLLAPITLPYAGLLRLRHALYDHHVLRSVRPSVPTIAIGNLALGGTGKTPMLELLLRTLADVTPLATLSRGYGRSGTGFREVLAEDTARDTGDEPLQVKLAFPEVRVFVGADRVAAIRSIEARVPGVRAVLLDDALQHRRLDASLNILLTTHQRPWCDDVLFPAGRLRDLPMRARAAQVVVVTKCPAAPTADEQREWRRRLGLRDGQELFFSGIEHDRLEVGRLDAEARLPDGQVEVVEKLKVEMPSSMTQPLNPSTSQPSNPSTPQPLNLLLITGIADPTPLLQHLRGLYPHVEHVAFPDHHAYTPADLQRLAELFDKFAPGPKALATTSKDAARLRSIIPGSPLEGLPVAVIGMRAVVLQEQERFDTLIRNHVAKDPAHR